MAFNEITNDAQLEQALRDAARELLRLVAKDVLLDFQEDYVWKHVYLPNSPIVYRRTFDFLNLWDFSDVIELADTLETTMSLDWQSMTLDEDSYTHSSYSPFGTDARSAMAEILDKDGASSSHPMSRKKGNAYWTIFWKEYVEGGKLSRVVDKHAKALGLIGTLRAI